MKEDYQVGFDEIKAGVKKLTDWENEPSVGVLREDLDAAKPSHDVLVGKIRHWEELRNVTGKQKPKSIKGRSSIQPKLVRRQAEWRYSALAEPFLSAHKLFSVEPRTYEDIHGARQNQTLLNWQFDTKLDKVKFIDEYVRTNVDEGTVIVRLGWQRFTEMEQVEVPVFSYMEMVDQASMDMLQQAVELQQSNPREYEENVPEELKASVDYLAETGLPTVAMITGSQLVDEEKIVENRPTLDILNFENVYIDPSCQGDIEKANFAVISFETSKAELKKDGRYANLDAVNWEGSTILAQPDHATTVPDAFNFKDDARKRIVAYEYWGFYDIAGDGVLVPIVATWVGDTMIRMERNPFPDQKIPLVVVNYLPVKRSLTGEPDAELIQDNQQILGAVTRGMLDLLGRSANSQQGFAKGFLDVTNRRRYENGEDYEFNPGAGDPRMSLHQHTYPEIPQSALTMFQLQNQEAEAMSGAKSFSGGLSGAAYGDVATGAKAMLDAASKREMNILRRLANGIRQIGVKITSMNAVFLTEKEVIRVTNETFVTVRRDEIKGNFDLICDIATPEVDEAKSQDLGFMLQTMGPNMDPDMSRMILAEIARLKRMPALAKKIESYQPQPDPMAERMKELAVAKLEKEIAELDSKIALNMAKARSEAANADNMDLDYLEQESGTKHERDLQRISVQAKSNENLEVTKALLKPKKPEETNPNVEAAVGFKRLADMGLM